MDTLGSVSGEEGEESDGEDGLELLVSGKSLEEVIAHLYRLAFIAAAARENVPYQLHCSTTFAYV